MTPSAKRSSSVSEPPIARERLAAAYFKARSCLLAQQSHEGYWTGELASSSLSTATAICALSLVDRRRFSALITGGVRWLLDHQNGDGGWGDTISSLSNISTTMLCRAALTMGREGFDLSERIDESLRRAERYLEGIAGGREPQALAQAVRARYGKDRTFSVPILSCCALAGLIEWGEAPPLPFELACLPASAYKWINLPVVSYALPALIALGIVQLSRRGPRNPVLRAIRQMAVPGALRKLEAIQPVNGGFLEATPLVSFVTMSLAGAERATHPVAQKGIDFLVKAVRPDGSWPIDTNLSTWVSTLSINALSEAGEGFGQLAGPLRRWLLDQQYRSVHPFTSAAPGGWGWTPLPGAVPDADDTAGALIALGNLGPTAESTDAAIAGLEWLLNLQNRDGGWPTFCRGWGHLPFDRSSADITAHALRALHSWKDVARSPASEAGGREAGKGGLPQRLQRAGRRGLRFLEGVQRPDGSWLPLWFGNQHAPDDENPVYGTARVLAAYRDLQLRDSEAARRGYRWLIACQREDGGWGGSPGVPPSVEETALAVDALINCGEVAGADKALARGVRWLVERVEDGSFLNASPIGFYFAKLWYFEKLYPLIFTAGALGRALNFAASDA
jgi:squalene-hopene/tetraprenyl-beta-curcumene cyclase